MQDLNCLATFPSEYYWTFPQAQEAPPVAAEEDAVATGIVFIEIKCISW